MTGPSFTSTARTLLNLFAGNHPRASKDVTVKSSAALSAGAVLGKCNKDTVGAPAADAGNTGDGTVTGVTLGAKAIPGTYTLLCIAAAANAGTFIVITPTGERLGLEITVGVAYTSAHLNCTVNDGATDFIVGDKFTIAISGTGKVLLAAAAAVDGSQDPYAILAEDADASGGDKQAVAYLTGEFAESALSFGAGYDADGVRDALEAAGIYLRKTVAA